MVGLLIVSHGGLGEALIQSAGHMLGKPLSGVAALRVTGRDDPELLLARGRDLVNDLDQGDGVLVMVDMFGATPGNITAKLLRAGRVEGVSGASLPMLVRALTYRESPLPMVLEKAISGGRDGVVHMNADCCYGPG